MAVRVRVRIERAGKASAQASLETVAVANSGYESSSPEALLPVRAAERLGLWPPPPGAHVELFESPAATFSMVTLPRVIRLSLAGARRGKQVLCAAVLSDHETEVVLNDHLVEALGIELIAVGRGLYRVGPKGKVRNSEPVHRIERSEAGYS